MLHETDTSTHLDGHGGRDGDDTELMNDTERFNEGSLCDESWKHPPNYTAPEELGTPIPAHTPHAISVTLPTWQANIGYEEGDPDVIHVLKSGYPRFVFHQQVRQLFEACQKKFARPHERCLVFPRRIAAEECRDFVRRFHVENPDSLSTATTITTSAPGKPSCQPAKDFRIAEQTLVPVHHPLSPSSSDPSNLVVDPIILYVVLFPAEAAPIAKQFWQHTGEGVTSRFAEHCLRVWDANVKSLKLCESSLKNRPSSQRMSSASAGKGGLAGDLSQSPKTVVPPSGIGRGKKSRYRCGPFRPEEQRTVLSNMQARASAHEQEMFVEERFGRNMDLRMADGAKIALRKRIAGIIGDAPSGDSSGDACAGLERENAFSDRGVQGVTEDDVFLFPTGMSAIYNAHKAVRKLFPGKKSVQFGFPYLDTLKIQQKFGPGCYFLGHGDENDFHKLDSEILTRTPSENIHNNTTDVSSVFCEFPSNPLLKSSDLKQLRKLANEHNFLLVVDETIGNFVNVEVLPWADIVVSSLTKIFSGDSNVMGGSVVLNPNGRFYTQLATIMKQSFEDTIWCQDAIFLERNSRSFRQRIQRINHTAEILCDYLVKHPKVERVYYPKYITPEIYNAHRRPSTPISGYGGLFSLILPTEEGAARFYDALKVSKGPSLGTNFTLVCPYTILAHYGELEWAEGFGVPRRLVRVSVGLEDTDWLLGVFEEALEKV
ncbi:hypothetical protein HK102_008967 [Quaeritorhiza haematococci]|nr:hypothetical protein HK102_008967 [Quaeritorhiza haematococci]